MRTVIYRKLKLAADVLVTEPLQSLAPLFHSFPWALGIRLHCRYINWDWNPHFQRFSSCWQVVAVCNGLCCKKKFLWRGTRTTLIYGYNDKYYEYSQTLYWCRKLIVVISSLSSLPWSATGSSLGLKYQILSTMISLKRPEWWKHQLACHHG